MHGCNWSSFWASHFLGFPFSLSSPFLSSLLLRLSFSRRSVYFPGNFWKFSDEISDRRLSIFAEKSSLKPPNRPSSNSCLILSRASEVDNLEIVSPFVVCWLRFDLLDSDIWLKISVSETEAPVFRKTRRERGYLGFCEFTKTFILFNFCVLYVWLPRKGWKID